MPLGQNSLHDLTSSASYPEHFIIRQIIFAQGSMTTNHTPTKYYCRSMSVQGADIAQINCAIATHPCRNACTPYTFQPQNTPTNHSHRSCQHKVRVSNNCAIAQHNWAIAQPTPQVECAICLKLTTRQSTDYLLDSERPVQSDGSRNSNMV